MHGLRKLDPPETKAGENWNTFIDAFFALTDDQRAVFLVELWQLQSKETRNELIKQYIQLSDKEGVVGHG